MLSIDHIGRHVQIPDKVQRIVSLVPSITELLADLNLEKEVVGITKFCVHPTNWYRNKQRIGGTKQLGIDAIVQLQPNLVIGNKEENVQSQIEALAAHCPVWISDIETISDAFRLITDIGQITNRSEEAYFLHEQITQAWANIKDSVYPKARVVYAIWQDPFMIVGQNNYIHATLEWLGYTNIGKTYNERYPSISIEEMQGLAPDVLMLSTEPFPFKQSHVDYWQTLLPNTRIIIVDGEMFSWYGSRMRIAPVYFHTLL